MRARTAGSPDWLIVGGGVIGLSIAYELLRRGQRVHVLAREHPGGGATAVAAGMLAPISEAPDEAEALVRLAEDSWRRYPEFVAGLERRTGISCRLRAEGTLWLAVDADQRAALEHLRVTLELRGMPVRRLDAEEVRTLEPHLSHRATCALLLAQDHQIDPRALAQSLEQAVRALGGLVETAEVERVEHARGCLVGLRVRDPHGAVRIVACGQAILAAGAAAGPLLEAAGLRLGLRPVKGQLLRLAGRPLIEHVVRTDEVYLVPRADGELLVGATTEEAGFDVTPTAGAAMDLLRRAFELLPAIYDLQLVEVAVGLRPAVADHLPVIGPSPIAGLFLAGGHFRNGVLLAPATAHYVAEWLTGNSQPPELAPFAVERLTQRATSAASEGARA